MDEPKTYLGASSRHLYCENYIFEPDTPIKVFNRDEVCTGQTWIEIINCNGISPVAPSTIGTTSTFFSFHIFRISSAKGVLDEKTFKNLPNLEIINLDKCNIVKIKENTFSSLPNLKSISLRKSSIYLDGNTLKSCDKLDNLRIIQIENGIDDPSAFKNMTNLEYLMIDHTQGLRFCEDSFLGLDNLKYLFIQNCKIEEFNQDAFLPLRNLETLYFNGNVLRYFNEKAFLSFRNLNILGLYDNSLRSSENPEIDYQIFEQLPELETIHFPEDIIRSLKLERFVKLKFVQIITGRFHESIVEFIESNNLQAQWTSDVDLTEEVDFKDPNLMICA